ncbi:MAG TPA: carboxypeptidase-like regulatory domain-containing protein, partial [Balneolaceae bacterium]|nr:carboxypeptidase-like regulatory domain-containing protein [Balneolaceae bacterium]
MKKYWLLFIGFLCISMTSQAQDFKVNGTVTGAGGDALPGVNILEKGTTNGTVTDVKGKYSINVGPADTLVFSYIGYNRKTIPVAGKSIIDVTLHQSTSEIGKVVVTAMGISQVKEKIGYSTQEIETGPIEDTNAQNLGNLFTGKVAGLSVDNPTGMFQGAKFSLRGKEPLIVVDDIPVKTNLFDISKNDIKEINVLKGTAASALYG